jgi:hypothetical protein
VGAATIRLQGGDPTVGDGFRVANENLGNIFFFAMISATVGMILRALSERGGWLGQIVASLLGFGWTVATFLVIPVMINEKISPVDAIKKSVNLFKERWGENLVFNAVIGSVFGWFFLPFAFLTVLGVAAGFNMDNMAIVFGSVIMMILAGILLSLFASALTGIYQAALYQFAANGQVQGFDTALLENTFTTKPKRGMGAPSSVFNEPQQPRNW